jgi:tetratricopeptide (TPR) repeat protein
VSVAACGGSKTQTAPSPGAHAINAGPALAGPTAGAIPAADFQTVMEAEMRGLGYMERYEYDQAISQFRKAHDLAPGWVPGSINLAIAILNQGGATKEEEKKKGQGRAALAPAPGPPAAPPIDATQVLKNALALLDDVLVRDPDNLHAHHCRGLIIVSLGPEFPDYMDAALAEFRFVAERDPTDGFAWYYAASMLAEKSKLRGRANPKEAEEQIALFTRALECNPYLVPAIYKLSRIYIESGRRADYDRVTKLFNRLNPQGQDNFRATGETIRGYGEMGKYSRVLEMRPGRTAGDSSPPPSFAAVAPVRVVLPQGDRWVRAADFTGKLAVFARARARFGAAIATFDADADGKADLYLAAAIHGADGVRDALLLNRGNGRFEVAPASWGIPADRPSLGVAAADFDADGHIDLFLSGVGDNRLLHNRGKGQGFEDVTSDLGDAAPKAVSPSARWIDLDQDGDLDLYVLNYTPAEHAGAAFSDKAPPGLRNMAYRNDGKPEPVPSTPAEALAPPAVATATKPAKGLSIAFTAWTDKEAADLLGGDERHTALAALDIDMDRDLDLVLAADGAVPTVVLNDRIGRFHALPVKDLKTPEPTSGLLVADFDRDGRPDLAAVPVTGRLAVWRNRAPKLESAAAPGFAVEFWPTDAHDWRQAQALDLDMDGTTDLVGLPAPDTEEAPAWSRNEGNRLATHVLALGRDEPGPLQGILVADLVGDALPDIVVVRDGEGPRLARNLGNGQHWLALQLGGRWKPGPDGGPMRTNPHGIGTRILVQGAGLNVSAAATTCESGPAQSVMPMVLGLGSNDVASLVRLTWPDGVMQCEMNQNADQLVAIAETCRKIGSCPVLFTWNGERFVCLGDFLGGGGLGYLVAPGDYSQPDRDEAVAIAPDQLKPVNGTYYLSVTEPMDELAYLEKLTLDVVDRPPGVSALPVERFAPGGNRPSGALLAWRETIDPARAIDLEGRDMTETLRHWDRRTVDTFRKLPHWIGYAEEHGILLDFGDRMARLGPKDRVALCLAGWVEYPYSQTNYAAATAGVALRPPVLERRRDDGSWEVIEPDPGYPAGMPRMTLLELTGKLTGPSCTLRLRTNMECYWDQAFLALVREDSGVRVTSLPVSKATLGARGYLREVSPDGRLPLTYDYNYVDPAPLARLEGKLTRYGDVTELLRTDDDQLCLVGPGDEARLEFADSDVPTLPEGWTRSYVLRAVGYCKDADPFTAASDRAGPLPWKGMGAYPFGPGGERPRDTAYEGYIRQYQTRSVGR